MANGSDGPLSDVIGIDPGRDKCGLAHLRADGSVAARAILAPDAVVGWVRRVQVENRARVLLGSGTGHRALGARLTEAGIAWQSVDETGTSAEARRRYLADHPARGLGRLVPAGLRVPDEPYDDYVALILAERALADDS